MRDPEETDPCVTALRELKEETGYTGHNPRVTHLVRSDPWKSNAAHCQVLVDVDLTLPENQNPVSDLEAEEDIHPIWFKLSNLREEVEKYAEENDIDIDQRVYAIALGNMISLNL